MNNPQGLDWNWRPPADWTAITTIDLHTGGEPLRVITGGSPRIEGDTVLEKRRYFREHYDHLRTVSCSNRGVMRICTARSSARPQTPILTCSSCTTRLQHQCGHAIIALTKLAIESGRVKGPGVSFNVPAGRIEATATTENGRVVSNGVSERPFILVSTRSGHQRRSPGPVSFDIAYGGAFYAIVETDSLGLGLDPLNYLAIIDAGRKIKHAIMKAMPIEHPFEPDLSFLYGTIFTGPAGEPGHHSRNVCVFCEGRWIAPPPAQG